VSNPVVRLALRALLVFVLSAAAQLQASDSWDGTVLRAALSAGVLAALEVFTKLNPSVGVGKT
jgi:hypothetical protein